jgi:hypothetical protein
MRVCIGFIAPNFVIHADHKWSIIVLCWLAACIALRVVGAVFVIFLRRWRTTCTASPANMKQEPIPEEMSQTLLTNKKLTLTARNTLFAL